MCSVYKIQMSVDRYHQFVLIMEVQFIFKMVNYLIYYIKVRLKKVIRRIHPIQKPV